MNTLITTHPAFADICRKYGWDDAAQEFPTDLAEAFSEDIAESAGADLECLDVDRGREIYALQKKLKQEMDQITARLGERAKNGKQIPLEDPERDGMQYIAKGSDGVTVPIILTADLVAKSFKAKSKQAIAVEKAAGGFLSKFYKKETVFKLVPKDGKALRKVAAEFLGEVAGALVSACLQRDKFKIPKSSVKPQWGREEEPEEEGEE